MGMVDGELGSGEGQWGDGKSQGETEHWEWPGRCVLICLMGHFIHSFIHHSFAFFRAAPAAYGNSQAGGRMKAAAAGLHHSHSNVGSEPHLGPTPQLTATLAP